MSLEKIAKILHVDEVRIAHGPRGVAVHVRLERSWRSAAIDNEHLGERRMEVIVEHLAHLADPAHRFRDNLRKSYVRADGATIAAIQTDVLATRPAMPSWNDVPFGRPYDGPLRQVQRVEPEPRAQPSQPQPEPAASEPMPSRFHAILAELRDL